MTVAEASQATGGALSTPALSSAEQCVYASWPSAPPGVRVMFEGGTLARVEVHEAGVPTPEGLEVGASAAQAGSVYGPRALRRPHKYSDGQYLIFPSVGPTDTEHRLVIEIVKGRVTTFRVGRFPPVEYVEGCG